MLLQDSMVHGDIAQFRTFTDAPKEGEIHSSLLIAANYTMNAYRITTPEQVDTMICG